MKKNIILLMIFLLCLLITGCNVLKKSILPVQDKGRDASNIKDGTLTYNVESREVIENQFEVKDKSPDMEPDNNTGSQKNKDSQSKEPVKKEKLPYKNFIKVDISEQKVYIYKNSNLIKTMMCSTGVSGKSTPIGTFKIGNRGTWFYSDKYAQGGKYWVEFKGSKYLFHSVPMDKNKNIIKSEAAKLGVPASHGCVRLSVEDALWIYNNAVKGTPVVIQK